MSIFNNANKTDEKAVASKTAAPVVVEKSKVHEENDYDKQAKSELENEGGKSEPALKPKDEHITKQ
jgi:hypothetical protein